MNASDLIRCNLEKVQLRTDINQTIFYQKVLEPSALRDRRNDIAGNPATGVVQIQAFRIYLNPTQKQMDRAGIKQGVSAIVWIRQDEFIQRVGSAQPDIIRDRIIIKGFENSWQRNYTIDEQHRSVMLESGYAFIVLGLIEDQ